MCDRGGEHNSIAILRRSGSKKIGCPFQLIGLYNEVRESWKLQVINDNHNHELAQNLEGHPYVRRFTQEEEDLVENLTERHMDPRNILSSIKKHNPANVSIYKDVYNLQQKIKNKKKFDDTPMQVLENVLHSQRSRESGRPEAPQFAEAGSVGEAGSQGAPVSGGRWIAGGRSLPYEKAWLPVNEGKASHTSVILTDELTKGPYPVDNSPRDIQKDSGGKTIECSYK
ncbi:hypothetical protein E3N88_14842 [Mikania micrantha]|uniref:Protein FAR1-RELATED SEQUENCE n=1 Tax=Mikania micrantha TaxID=192012 RepID=A0A5N6P2V2_9ASTR|nr:hypothetical protein E3N88_14842 [Mikania micrantha]